MYVVTMKLPGIEPAGIVDAILDHGGPIVTNLRILSSSLGPWLMSTKNAVMGLLNDLLGILVRQTPQEHSIVGFPIQCFRLRIVMEPRSTSSDTYLFVRVIW